MFTKFKQSSVNSSWGGIKRLIRCARMYDNDIFSMQFNFIYIAPNHNNSCLKVLCIKRSRPYNNTEKTEKPPTSDDPYEQALCSSGRKILPFNREKPPGEPGSDRGGHLSANSWGEGKKTRRRQAVEESHRIILAN